MSAADGSLGKRGLRNRQNLRRPVKMRNAGVFGGLDEDEDGDSDLFDEDQEDFVDDSAPARPRRSVKKSVVTKRLSRHYRGAKGSEESWGSPASKQKRKVFDYESAIAELKRLQEDSTHSPLPSRSATRPVADSPTPVDTQIYELPPVVTPSTGGKNSVSSAIMKDNIELRYENKKLLKEKEKLQAKVEVLLNLLVEKSAQLQLLQMACMGDQMVDEADIEL